MVTYYHSEPGLLVKKLLDNEALTVSGGATPSVTSGSLLVGGGVRKASAITLTLENDASTDCDFEVQTSYDNSNWDDDAYTTVNLGANKQRTVPLTVGMRYVRVKATNNDASNATTVSATATVRREI